MIELIKALQLLRNFIHCSAPVKVKQNTFFEKRKNLYLKVASVNAC